MERYSNALFLRFIFILLSLGAMSGCGKDDDPTPQPTEPLPVSEPIRTQGDFLKKYMPASQYFTISRDTSVYTEDSTLLTFDYSQFYDASGRLPYNEIREITIEVKELTSVQDMIFAGQHSEGFLFNTGGISSLVSDRILYLNAQSEGYQLSASGNYCHLQTEIESSSLAVKNLYLFFFGKRYYSNPSDYRWSNNLQSVPTRSIDLESYSSDLRTLDWANFAYLYKYNAPFTIVDIDSSFFNYVENTVGYMVYDDARCVRRIGFGASYGTTSVVPIGESLKIFIYKLDRGKIFLFQKDIVAIKRPAPYYNHLVTPDFKEVTEKELIAAIEAL